MSLIHAGNESPGGKKAVRCLDAGHLDGIIEVVSINAYPRQKVAYTTAGLPEFRGFHKDASATVADINWIVTKYAYDGSSRFIDSQTLVVAWSAATASAWDI